MNDYYNTTNETDPLLVGYKRKARTQQEEVLDFFIRTKIKRTGWTPSEAHRHVLKDAPPTSIRRAITNLTAEGKLVKTDVLRTGPHKRREHCWKLKESQDD
jgi:hypothetical protein